LLQRAFGRAWFHAADRISSMDNASFPCSGFLLLVLVARLDARGFGSQKVLI